MGVALACSIGGLQAEVVIVETIWGMQNTNAYTEISGSWFNSGIKSAAPGTTSTIKWSRASSSDGAAFLVSPMLTNAGGKYIVDVTHGKSTNIPTNLLASVTVTGGTGLPATTDMFNQLPDGVWRTVGTVTLDAGVTNPTFTFTKTGGPYTSPVNRFYADAIRFTYAGDPCLQTPQIDTVNGPLAEGQTYVNVPTVLSNATEVIVYADGVEIGRLAEGIDGGVETVPTSPLVKGQIINATQVWTNAIESCKLTTGPKVGGGANPRIRISLSIRQNTALTGPIGTNGGVSGTPIVFLGATNVFGGAWGAAPVGGKVFEPDVCWQTVTIERGLNPSNPTDPTYAWSGSTGDNSLQGNFGVLDAIAFAIDDLTDTGPFRIYIDDLRNGGVLVQGWENATNQQDEVTFLSPGDPLTNTKGALLAQPPGDYSPDLARVTDEYADAGKHSMLVSWQFLDSSGPNWVRLLARGSETPNPQLDLRMPITFRMLLMPAGMVNPPLQICTQPQNTSALQTRPLTVEVRAVGTAPLTYQWYFQDTLLTGETNRTLEIPSADIADSGVYYVVVTDATGSVTSGSATVVVEPAAFTDAMQSWWAVQPNDRSYLAPDGQQSGLAYNPATSNLLLVTRTGGDAVLILDGETGADEGGFVLDPFDVFGGYYLVNKIAATPSGWVFVCNLTTNATLDPFKVYFWMEESTTLTPTTIWQGDPSGEGGRWGDVFDAREVDVGGTAYPEFVAAAQDDNKLAVMQISTLTDYVFTLGDVPPGAFNHGLCWGEGDTVWGKSYQGDLYHIGLDFGNGTATVLHTYTNVPSLAPIRIEPARQLLGAVSVSTPDTLRLFSVADLDTGLVALDTESFQADNPWAPAAGAVAFGPNQVYALNPNHGIVAMQLNLRPELQLARTNQFLTLKWSGAATLQAAPAVTGTYSDIGGATSPFVTDMSTNTQQYFRLRQ